VTDLRPRHADGVLVGAESIVLDRDGPRGVLILHGFNDTPQSVGALAQWMHAAGWGVRAPLLPGHGRTPAAFAAEGSAEAWVAAARAEWAALRARYATVVVMGQSMGGALAVLLAAEDPPAGVVLFAPYLAMGRRARLLSRSWPLWRLFVPALRGKPERGLVDPVARSQSLGGGPFPLRMVAELRAVVDRARGVAGRVRAPVLVIQGRRDYRVPARSVRRGFSVLGSSDKTLVWREGVGHVVAADAGREEVFGLVELWLRARV
jgi:carboxylesterase